jgi:ribosomal protein L11 methyltransferase
MAFGTGLHATTQLAARLIMEAAEICCHSRPVSGHGAGSSGNPVITTNPSSLPAGRNDISMCDVGCGSGILSIIAAKKGVGRITAVEIDADAAASANENIARNGFADTIRVLDKICKAGGRFDIVAANILFATIIELKPDLLRLARRGGFLILSGITKEEDERFMAANKNLELVKKAEQDGWMGYMYRAF